MNYLIKGSSTTILVVFLLITFTTISFGEEMVKGVVVADSVNVRTEADINSTTIKKLNIGEDIKIMDSNADWFNIKLEDGTEGWIYGDLMIPVENDLTKKWIVTGENVNLREGPSLDSPTILQLQKNNELIVSEKTPQWYRVTLQNNTTGWISSQFVSPKIKYSKGEITGSDVNLRSTPSIVESNVLTQLSLYDQVTIKNYKDEWYYISTEKNTGWVHEEFVNIITSNTSKEVSRSSSRSATQFKIVDFAKKYLGTPYKYGSNGPSSFDCSGYTTYVFKHVGIKLPRTSSSQGKTGEKIKRSNLAIGDLVFFDTSGANNGNISHVGIYLGDGEFIHASSGSKAKKVIISSLDEGYYNSKFVVARRVF